MKRKCSIFCLLILVVSQILINGCDNPAPASATAAEDINVSGIKAAVNSGSTGQVVNALNKVKSMRYQDEVILLLQDLWSDRRVEHPDLNWDLVSRDVVRIEIANVLAQAAQNGRSDIDVDALRNFAITMLESDDPDARIAAIGTIRIFDMASDVPRLLDAGIQEDHSTYRAVVLALTGMCTPEAEAALDTLYASVESSSAKEIIQENRKEMSAYKARTGLCDDL